MRIAGAFIVLAAALTTAVGLTPGSSRATSQHAIGLADSAGLTWSAPVKLTDRPLDAVSCPTVRLCVAIGQAADVWTTTTAASSSPVWLSHPTHGDGFQSLSCPTASFCAAGDFAEDVFTTTRPISGNWRKTELPYGMGGPSDLTGILGLSCVSGHRCVGVDSDGLAVVSRNPTGGAGRWQHAQLTPNSEPLHAVSCVQSGLCVAVGDYGYVATTTNAAGGPKAWTVRRPFRAAELAVSCASQRFCVATDVRGNVLTTTDPTGGVWHRAAVDGQHVFTGVSCPTTTFCVAVDADGGVLTTTDPTGGSSAWTRTKTAVAPNLEGISCPNTRLCVAVDGTGVVVVGRPLTPAAARATRRSTTHRPLLSSDLHRRPARSS